MTNGPVICNTSPLIKLAGVALLDLLPQLYGLIVIPAVVQGEYLAGIDPGSPDIRQMPWLSVQVVTIEPALQALAGFGADEAAVISLAQAMHARLVVLDDKRAR